MGTKLAGKRRWYYLIEEIQICAPLPERERSIAAERRGPGIFQKALRPRATRLVEIDAEEKSRSRQGASDKTPMTKSLPSLSSPQRCHPIASSVTARNR